MLLCPSVYSVWSEDIFHFIFTRAIFLSFNLNLCDLYPDIYLSICLFIYTFICALQYHWSFKRDLIGALCSLHTVSYHSDPLLRHLFEKLKIWKIHWQSFVFNTQYHRCVKPDFFRHITTVQKFSHLVLTLLLLLPLFPTPPPFFHFL